ncbi:MAG: methylated-DNA-[protein]-cysteine S-methyltransferase [Thermoplasmata archaeon]|jgi:methylated-DNA-[protein]-cysteine S-methyltransferase|nr:methylated-DNA-[protein]-cysteine S-methyltransferase [Thermoplasmata archaeon]
MTDARLAARKALQPAARSHVGTWSAVDTPFGRFHVAALDGAIVQTSLPTTPTERFLDEVTDRHPNVEFHEDPRDPLLQQACAQLVEYAAGRRRQFDVPVRLDGTTFQRKVWSALAEIPFGETRSYQDIARLIGRPGASRAVGQANHENPVAPIVPCHRVVTSSGTLGGYGGGMDLKRQLLQHEGVQLE